MKKKDYHIFNNVFFHMSEKTLKCTSNKQKHTQTKIALFDLMDADVILNVSN